MFSSIATIEIVAALSRPSASSSSRHKGATCPSMQSSPTTNRSTALLEDRSSHKKGFLESPGLARETHGEP